MAAYRTSIWLHIEQVYGCISNKYRLIEYCFAQDWCVVKDVYVAHAQWKLTLDITIPAVKIRLAISVVDYGSSYMGFDSLF